ncbi:MAG: hypothetical protein V7K77_25155 [Nostoc sp.]|uniref:hypothetical protein n=1 Tax=Nostoc sp. TaxID=1180 RepID=UPI002FFA0F9E
MQNTLFTALSTNEEANLSGGLKLNARGGDANGGRGGRGGDAVGGVVIGGSGNTNVNGNTDGGTTTGGSGGSGGSGGFGGFGGLNGNTVTVQSA